MTQLSNPCGLPGPMHEHGSEAGYTLVESIVALSLLLSVLAPLVGSLAYFTGQHLASREALALAAGRRQLESLLAEPAAWPDSATVEVDRWRVVRRVRREGRLVLCSVVVFEREAGQPLLTLSTWRFVP